MKFATLAIACLLTVSSNAIDQDSTLQSLKEETQAYGNPDNKFTGNGKNEGRFILTAGIFFMLGCAWYHCSKKKDSSQNEGGQIEDKKLFKKVFKGKTHKKAAKEGIIELRVTGEEQV